MKSQTTAVLAGFTASLTLGPTVAQAQYTYKTLSFPLPWSAGAFTGIDGSNIVGSYNEANGGSWVQHGFVFNGTSYTTLDEPLSDPSSQEGAGTWATGISGMNIVGYFNNDAGTGHGFLYNGTTWTSLDDPSAGSGLATFPEGVSGTNVVGYYLDGSSARAAHGFLYNGSNWTTLDYPGAAQTYANGVSGSAVVGNFTDTNGVSHGFLYNPSAWTALDAPASAGTYAEGIYGVNIVGYYNDTNAVSHGFLYDGTNWTTLDDPQGANGSQAHGISGSNILGNFYTNEYFGEELFTLGHGFLYNAGSYKTLDDPLNSLPTSTVPAGIDGTNIVGCFIWAFYPDCDVCSPQPWQGFLYTGGAWSSFANPLGVQSGNVDNGLATPLGTVATGISETSIVGSYYDANYSAHGFSFRGGVWTTLDDPLAGVSTPNSSFTGTFPKGIAGPNIVGYFLDANSAAHGFVYNSAAWTTLDYPGSSGTYATGISGGGVVGSFRDTNAVSHGFLYDTGVWTVLDAPQASESSSSYAGTYATGINGTSVVGFYFDTNAVAHGFLYNGGAWTTLDDPGAGSARGMGTFAQGISGPNIVGYFVNRYGENFSDPIAIGFLATPLPKLAVASSGSGVKLSWPSNPLASWLLQQTASLGTTHWTPTPGVSNDGTNNFITVTPSSQTQFFRLTLQ